MGLPSGLAGGEAATASPGSDVALVDRPPAALERYYSVGFTRAASKLPVIAPLHKAKLVAQPLTYGVIMRRMRR